MHRFRAKLQTGSFAVTAEASPPRDGQAGAFLRQLREIGALVDAVNITDNPGASIRASALAGAALALHEGIDPILQLTCRDRNRLALQSDLLGAWLLGVDAVLAMTGDPLSVGDNTDAKPVFDLDSIQLIAMARGMRDGRLANGTPLNHPPGFLIGGAESPLGGPPQQLAERLERKADAGIDFVQTQFVFVLEPFLAWLDEVKRRGLDKRVAIIAGVGLVRTFDRAIWLRDHLPGSNIPPELVAAFAGLDRAEGEALGLEHAAGMVRALRETKGIAGVHLMPIGWPSGVPRLLELLA